MAKTITIVVPPKKTPTTTKKGTVRVRKTTDETNTEATEPLKQRFFATHSEKGITIKFGNISFGVMRGDSGGALENFMRGNENKDTEKIQKIIAIIKPYMRANI